MNRARHHAASRVAVRLDTVGVLRLDSKADEPMARLSEDRSATICRRSGVAVGPDRRCVLRRSSRLASDARHSARGGEGWGLCSASLRHVTTASAVSACSASGERYSVASRYVPRRSSHAMSCHGSRQRLVVHGTRLATINSVDHRLVRGRVDVTHRRWSHGREAAPIRGSLVTEDPLEVLGRVRTFVRRSSTDGGRSSENAWRTRVFDRPS